VAEGPKVISELILSGFKLKIHFTTDITSISDDKNQIISTSELQKLSYLKTANTSLALFEIPVRKTNEPRGLVLALDAVRDPGNLGTIIRLCDWFDVHQLVCSNDCVDCFNPKVIQASMGSIARVQVTYLDLSDYMRSNKLPVYGACLNGNNLYDEKFPQDAIIVMGNEANGISNDIMNSIDHKITIPQFGTDHATESLNVATATSVILSEFKRSTGR
jgi:TrmH family RNA methyltransferase